MKRAALVVLMTGVLAACQDGGEGPLGSPDFQLADASSNATVPGPVPGFYFHPPIVPSPDFEGVFNPNLRPWVEIHGPFTLDTILDANGNPIIDPATGGPLLDVIDGGCDAGTLKKDLGTAALGTGETYATSWKPRKPDSDKPYRVCVFSTAFEDLTQVDRVLGWRDVMPSTENVDNRATDQSPVYRFQSGSNLPIKFRIENGAVGCFEVIEGQVVDCVETFIDAAQGGAAICTDQTCAVELAAGTLNEDAFFVVRRLECNESTDENPQFIPGLALPQFPGCLDIATDAVLAPGQTAVVAACITAFVEDPNTGDMVMTPALEKLTDSNGEIIDGIAARLQLHHLDEATGAVHALPNTFSPIDVQCDQIFHEQPIPSGIAGAFVKGARAVKHLLGFEPKTAYALNRGVGGSTGFFSPFVWALPAQMEKLNWQETAASGATVAPTVKVTNDVTDACDGFSTVPCPSSVPVPGAVVMFDVMAGNGTIVSQVPVLTDKNGIASANWALPSAPGRYELDASGLGLGLAASEIGFPVPCSPDGANPCGPFAKHFRTATDDGLVLLQAPPLTFEVSTCSDKTHVLDTPGVEADYENLATVPINISGSDVDEATLYWTTDCFNTYFALDIPASDGLENSLRFVFVDGNDVPAGNAQFTAVPDLGDDMWNIFRDRQGNWHLEDWHVADDCKGNKQSECGEADPVQNLLSGPGGPVSTLSNGSTVFEFARCFPDGGGCLTDPDGFDFAVPAIGGTERIGFYLVLQRGNGAQGNTEWPDFRVFQPIEIVRQ